MRRCGRKSKILLAFTVTFLVVFFIEIVSYISNSKSWPELKEEKCVKILLVADPQIPGYKNEHFLFGYVTRWDADSYLKKNYRLARQHLNPQIVIFLGDLFDEGVEANDPEYRTYFKRFVNIFDLPKKQDPSQIEYIFIPGDNDVGGEDEPINKIKLKWFNQTFGDFHQDFSYKKNNFDMEFIKANLFIPDAYKNPMEGRRQIESYGNSLRIFLSHISMLSFRTQGVETLIDKYKPSLIISAHMHKSVHFITSKTRELHITHEFMENGGIYKNEFLEDEVHEISVPTPSYRMGVNKMGFGALNICQNGNFEYTVLWLPSRFSQLYVYAIFYVALKLVISPWVFWKLGTWLWEKYKKSERIRKFTA